MSPALEAPANGVGVPYLLNLRLIEAAELFATPKKCRSITVDTIARAMVATSRPPPAASAVDHDPAMTRRPRGDGADHGAVDEDGRRPR